jgi:hypothetical protein
MTGIAGIAIIALFLKAAPGGGQTPIEIDVAAPELTGGPWLNTPQNRPLSLASRRGKVTILHFWTFG